MANDPVLTALLSLERQLGENRVEIEAAKGEMIKAAEANRESIQRRLDRDFSQLIAQVGAVQHGVDRLSDRVEQLERFRDEHLAWTQERVAHVDSTISTVNAFKEARKKKLYEAGVVSRWRRWGFRGGLAAAAFITWSGWSRVEAGWKWLRVWWTGHP